MLSTVKKVQFLSNHKLVCSVRQLFVLGPRCILFIALIHASIFADLLWERVTLMLSASKRMAKINGQPAFLCGRSSETLKYVFRKKHLCYTTEPKYSPLSIGRSGNFACFQQAIWKNSEFGILFSLLKFSPPSRNIPCPSQRFSSLLFLVGRLPSGKPPISRAVVLLFSSLSVPSSSSLGLAEPEAFLLPQRAIGACHHGAGLPPTEPLHQGTWP